MPDIDVGRSHIRNDATLITVICFCVIALYNVLELLVIIFTTFKKRGGLYFWSFLVSTLGISLNSSGYLVRSLQESGQKNIIYSTLIVVGWCSMVTGQSVVLYSRLHLVLRNLVKLRMVLLMIITNAIVCHIPVTVLVYGANSNNPDLYLGPYSIYEKIQITVFFLQELIISGLYIYQTIRILKPEGNIRGKAGRQIMAHLIYVNTVIVVLDITILALEYAGLYDIQTAYKSMVYSIKLKLEFGILNELVELTQTGRPADQNSSGVRAAGENFSAVWSANHERLRRQSRLMMQQITGYSAFITSGGMQEKKERANFPEDTIMVSRTVVAVHSDGVSVRENKDWGALDMKEVGSTSSREEKGEELRDEKGWKMRPSLSTQSSFTQFVKEGPFLSLSPAETRGP